MKSWDLGAGFDDIYTLTRRLIRHHLANPLPVHLAMLDRLLIEPVEPGSINPSTRKQAVALLSELFTQEDWQAMAEAALRSILSRMLSAGEIQSEITTV